MKSRNEAIRLLCGVSMILDKLQVELCRETPYETPTVEETRKRILSTFDSIDRIDEILANMELTWQDISKIVRLYNEIEREDEQNAFEWSMNEDNTGISYNDMTHEDICRQVLSQINK